MRLVSMILAGLLMFAGTSKAGLFSHTEVMGTQGPVSNTHYEISVHYNPFDSSLGTLMATMLTTTNNIQFVGVGLNIAGTWGDVRSFSITNIYQIAMGDMIDVGTFSQAYENVGYLFNVDYGPYVESHTLNNIMGAGFDPTNFTYQVNTAYIDPGDLFNSMSFVITSHVTVTYDYMPFDGDDGVHLAGVPEPSSIAMLSIGLIGMVGFLKYKK